MTILAIILSIVAIYFLEENNALSSKLTSWLPAIILFVGSIVLLCLDYGVMRGIFVFIGLLSLLGTIVTLLPYRFSLGKT
ncbi:MAG: hypothetical protein MK214_14725 [Thalassotalea sp.]|nr:hypothetical protein [Thalassotalea sp.]